MANKLTQNKREDILPKSFDDLIKEVHEKGICGECGGCVSFCSADEIKAIGMTNTGPPQYTNEDNCLSCGICYLICPQTHILDEELNKKYNYKTSIGNWQKVCSSQASNENILYNATDGGMVTALLTYLLDNHMIQGAIVSKEEGILNRVPFFAKSRDQLIQAAGSHYDLSHAVVELENYDSFVPTITELKHLMDTQISNIAIVGTPCQIHSIRKMQELSILPAHIIKYTFGLFCNFNFSFTIENRKILEEKFHFSFDTVDHINIKEELILHIGDKEKLHIPFENLTNMIRPACYACKDFSNIYSDISFGGLGSKNNLTTTLIRTPLGKKVYDGALREGYIIEPHEVNTSVKKSEMLAKIISFGKRKYKRYKETIERIQ
ncbi:MAG: coenzyme F420 hydrogenase [Candidatus Lokiarchaeota archaeon]|nr:coenzyme F420 hydrogenase [Candidatus Lokiarchaeota archaeon]